jgi:hypothetical protein
MCSLPIFIKIRVILTSSKEIFDEVHADLDGSGIVDVGDILIIVADWGPVGG